MLAKTKMGGPLGQLSLSKVIQKVGMRRSHFLMISAVILHGMILLLEFFFVFLVVFAIHKAVSPLKDESDLTY